MDDKRLTEVETLLTHLQQMLFDLNTSVVSQQKQLDTLSREFARIVAHQVTIRDSLYQRPSAEEERPPHY